MSEIIPFVRPMSVEVPVGEKVSPIYVPRRTGGNQSELDHIDPTLRPGGIALMSVADDPIFSKIGNINFGAARFLSNLPLSSRLRLVAAVNIAISERDFKDPIKR